jgi:hypothetical protein
MTENPDYNHGIESRMRKRNEHLATEADTDADDEPRYFLRPRKKRRFS